MFKFLLNLFTGKGLHVAVRGDRLMICYKGEFSDKTKDAVERILTGKAHARAFPVKVKRGERGIGMVEQPSFTVADGSIYQTGSGRRPE